GQVVDGPAPEVVVGGEGQTVVLLEPAEVAAHAGRRAGIRRRGPQDPRLAIRCADLSSGARLGGHGPSSPAATSARARAATTSSTISPSNAIVWPPASSKAASRRRPQASSSGVGWNA